MLILYLPHETEISTSDHRLLVWSPTCICNLHVRIHVPVFVVDFFYGGLVEDLRGADVVNVFHVAEWDLRVSL